MSPLSRSLPCARHRRRAGHRPRHRGALVKAGATVTVLGRNRATRWMTRPVACRRRASCCLGRRVADQACRRSNRPLPEAAARQPIDILIANAGAAESCAVRPALDAALFQRMMDVNFMGVVHATQAVLPGMVERAAHGRIVAVASTAGLKGYAYVSAPTARRNTR